MDAGTNIACGRDTGNNYITSCGLNGHKRYPASLMLLSMEDED